MMNKIMNDVKKRNHTIAVVIIIAAMLSMVLAGCGGKVIQDSDGSAAASTAADTTGEQTVTEQAASATEEESTTQNFPLNVTDGNGDEMTIESEPQRVISLTLGSDEMLLGLIDKSRILALTQYADDAGISNVAAEAAGVSARTSLEKMEEIIALTPDLVIVDTWADPNGVKQLRDAGITVYAFKTPSNIDEQKATIIELAKITGSGKKGKEIIEWMDAKLKAVEEKLAQLKPEEKLTVMDYGEMGSSGIGTNVDDIMTRAGLTNVVARAGMEGWPTVTKEKIIEFNPDVIILPSWFYDPNNTLESMKNTLKNDESLKTVNAVKDDKLITVPNPHISAISQYVVLSVEDLAGAAYPELFK